MVVTAGARPVPGLQPADAAAGRGLPRHQRGAPLPRLQPVGRRARPGLPVAVVDAVPARPAEQPAGPLSGRAAPPEKGQSVAVVAVFHEMKRSKRKKEPSLHGDAERSPFRPANSIESIKQRTPTEARQDQPYRIHKERPGNKKNTHTHKGNRTGRTALLARRNERNEVCASIWKRANESTSWLALFFFKPFSTVVASGFVLFFLNRFLECFSFLLRF